MQKVDLLIVEDDAAIRAVVTGALGADCIITAAANGKDGIAAAEANPPDVILLDVGLPDMSGYEVCRHLKADPRFERTPIIFLTAMEEMDKELKGIEAGGIDYLTKPVNILQLRARLKNHFALAQPPRRTRT